MYSSHNDMNYHYYHPTLHVLFISLYKAARMAPTDEKIQERIETIESVLINTVRATTSDSGNTTTTTTTMELLLSSTSNTVTKKHNDNDDSVDVEEVEEQRKEQLRFIIEDSLTNYPRVTHAPSHHSLSPHR